MAALTFVLGVIIVYFGWVAVEVTTPKEQWINPTSARTTALTTAEKWARIAILTGIWCIVASLVIALSN